MDKDNKKEIPKIELKSETMNLEQIKPGIENQENEEEAKNVKEKEKNLHKNKGKKRVLWTLVGLGILFLVFILGLTIPSFFVYRKAQKLIVSAQSLEGVVREEQDIDKIKQGITQLRSDLLGLQKSFKYLSWTKPIPLLSAYYQDGEAVIKAGLYGMDAAELVVTTIEPYADIIGFKGDESEQAQSGEESASDRVEFVVQTINEVIPQLEVISEKTKLVQTEIDKINPNRYPVTFAGKKIREKIRSLIVIVDEVANIIGQGKPLLEVAPYLLGIDEQRTYLILFQNDKELRPTGGFMTAYSIMSVDKGKFKPVLSNDIYNLDARYTPVLPAPEPIIKYIKGPYVLSRSLRLRDMNFNPDFKNSMELFTQEVQKLGIRNIDGVIAVDTQVLVNLLEVTGEIGVPGFGNFSTKIIPECDCPQVIYELESFADTEGPIVWDPVSGEIVFAPPNIDNRKKIIGPLMNSILSNAMGQPKDKLPELFEAGYKSLTEKHVLFYMLDEEVQRGVEAFNIAGRLKDYQEDYLHINDANLGGRKSNLYVSQEVHQEIEIARDGSVEKLLTITYKNPQDYDGWLNSVLPNWTRIYVPLGSELISVDGLEEAGETYEELGKTVFCGGFRLRPQGVVKLSFKYKLPFKFNKEYKLLIQKQAGHDSPLYTISLGKQEEEFFLKTDKELRFRI